MSSRPRPPAPILQRVTTALGTTWVERYPRGAQPAHLPAVCLISPDISRPLRASTPGVVYERDHDRGSWVATGWWPLAARS
ncbi:MAG: hypothetical protein JWN04_4267 [Myxococcaceae bacterium]|nr:hypothetical protein [Myxococcaceae bacterium]